MRVCTICRHDRRLDMEAQALIGVPLSTVARRYGVSRQAVKRHTSHIQDVLEKSAEFQARYGDGLTRKIREHEEMLERLLRLAVAGENAVGAAASLRDLVRMYRAIARVSRGSAFGVEQESAA